MSQRAYRPYRLNVDNDVYEVELGRPGKPPVYRIRENGQRIRVPEDDEKTLVRIAHALRHDVDMRKAEDARQAKIRASRAYRWPRALARPFIRFYWWCMLQIARTRR